MNSPKTEQRAFLILLGLLSFAGIYLLWPFLNAIIMAMALAVLFHPLHGRYLRLTRGHRNAATFLSVLSVVLFLVIPLAVVLTLVTAQLSGLIVPDTTASEPAVSEVVGVLQRKLVQLARTFEEFFGESLNLIGIFRKGMAGLAEKVAPYSPKVISGTANFFLHLFMFLVLLTYLLRDGKSFIDGIIRITPIKDRYERRLAAEIRSVIREIFYGYFLTGLVQAALATFGFFLLDIEGYLVWGSLVFFVSFLPIIGTGAVLVPMTIVLFAQGRTTQGLILAVYGGVVIAGIDNLLRPLLMRTNMHSMFLFLSIFGGLVVFGPIGILLGPMLMGLLTATVRIYLEDFEGRENLTSN